MAYIPKVTTGQGGEQPPEIKGPQGEPGQPINLQKPGQDLSLPPLEMAVKMNLLEGTDISERGGKYYVVKRDPGKGGFNISIVVFDKDPLKNPNIKPTKELKDAFWITEKQEHYYNVYTVYRVQNGQKVLDPQLKEVKQLARLPSNLADMKKYFPEEYKKLYQGLLVGITMKIISEEKKAQAKWKQSQQQNQ